MELALQVRTKLGFIDGSVEKNFENDFLASQWDRCNSVVLSWILNSVSEDLYVGQIFSKISKDVWDELKETYDGSAIYNLHKQINSTTQSGLSTSAYYHKLNSLWRQYDMLTKLPKCTCNASTTLNEFSISSNSCSLLGVITGPGTGPNSNREHINLRTENRTMN
jgi:hypothetical protein